MEHGIRFSTLSVFRTNYIVPGALHTIRSRFLPFVHFFASSFPFNVLNLIVFVLIRLLNSPFTAFFFHSNFHSQRAFHIVDTNYEWTYQMSTKWKKRSRRVYQFAHQMNTISFHFIFSIRLICPRDTNANGYFSRKIECTRLFVHATTDSICMHHSVTTDARWENFHSNGRKEVVHCRRYSMHNRLKSLLPILRTIALLSSGSYRDKVRRLFSIATFSAVRFVTSPISIDPIARFHFSC